MARLARTVIPGTPHHVTQRGNRRLPVFFSDDDRRLYLALIRDGCARAQVRCLGWCLMDNHVHLILVPETADGLRAALGEAHRRYTRAVNFREGWRGYLFQGRFASYAIDDAHLLAALRYVEHNPVAAGIVEQPADWPWSSARSHLAGRRARGDRLTDLAALAGHVPNWRTYLRFGPDAGGLGAEGEAVAEAIEAACAPDACSARTRGSQRRKRIWAGPCSRNGGGPRLSGRVAMERLISIVSPELVSPELYDASLAPKSDKTAQVRDFYRFGNSRMVTIVRPMVEGKTYDIPRPHGL